MKIEIDFEALSETIWDEIRDGETVKGKNSSYNWSEFMQYAYDKYADEIENELRLSHIGKQNTLDKILADLLVDYIDDIINDVAIFEAECKAEEYGDYLYEQQRDRYSEDF